MTPACSRVTGKPVAKAWISGDGGVHAARSRCGALCDSTDGAAQAAGYSAAQLAPRAGAQLLALALQLAAGGEDVAAARRADRRGVAGAVEDRGEGLDGPPVGALVVGCPARG